MTRPDEVPESCQESQPDPGRRPQAGPRAAGPLRGHWLWIALTAAVALAGLAAVHISGHSPAFLAVPGAQVPAAGRAAGPASPAGPAMGNPDATEPVPAGIPTSAGVANTSTSRLPRQLAASLARWKAGPGGGILAALSTQAGSATQSAGVGLYASMRLACVKVGTAVTAALAAPPIPDAAMQRWYARALASLANAAADCRTAISVRRRGPEDLKIREFRPALNRSTAEFATGTRDLFLATAKLSGLRRR